jgi:threonine dehydratase
MDYLIINEEHIQVESFKYLGSLLNKGNSVEEKIKERFVITASVV